MLTAQATTFVLDWGMDGVENKFAGVGVGVGVGRCLIPRAPVTNME